MSRLERETVLSEVAELQPCSSLISRSASAEVFITRAVVLINTQKNLLLYGSWEDQRRRQFNKFHSRANCSITSQSRLYRTVSSSITTQIEKLQHVARWLLCATHQCFLPSGPPQPCPHPPKKLLRGSPREGLRM